MTGRTGTPSTPEGREAAMLAGARRRALELQRIDRWRGDLPHWDPREPGPELVPADEPEDDAQESHTARCADVRRLGDDGERDVPQPPYTANQEAWRGKPRPRRRMASVMWATA